MPVVKMSVRGAGDGQARRVDLDGAACRVPSVEVEIKEELVELVIEAAPVTSMSTWTGHAARICRGLVD